MRLGCSTRSMLSTRNVVDWNMAFCPLMVVVLMVGTTGGGSLEVGRAWRNLSMAHDCPRCDTLFTALEDTADGKRVQKIQVQERGEPKSGTTFMFQWARDVLHRTCEYLKNVYGKETCRLQDEGPLGYYKAPNEVIFTFEPHLAGDDAMCTCDGLDQVRISVNQTHKHMLPVNHGCRWNHNSNIEVKGHGCTRINKRPVQDFMDLWLCMEESNCAITDNRLQFVLMRDPRAVAVSLYYHMQVHPSKIYGSNPPSTKPLNEGVLALLPEVCQWLAIRHILFEGLMADVSTVFWYQDSQDNPLAWHYRWAASVGLQLPPSLIESMANDAITRNFSFEIAGYNEHPGKKQPMEERSWQSEISAEVQREMNAILNTWLPPVVLARLGVAPQ